MTCGFGAFGNRCLHVSCVAANIDGAAFSPPPGIQSETGYGFWLRRRRADLHLHRREPNALGKVAPRVAFGFDSPEKAAVPLKKCPACGSDEVRRSYVRPSEEGSHSFRSPYRCQKCHKRFWVISGKMRRGLAASCTMVLVFAVAWMLLRLLAPPPGTSATAITLWEDDRAVILWDEGASTAQGQSAQLR
jgi:hypothetical protein